MQFSSRFSPILAVASLLGVALVGSADYFPKGIFSESEPEDQAWSERFSERLSTLREVPLYGSTRKSITQTYRFLWERSFHPVVVVRLDIYEDGSGIIETKIARTKEGPKKEPFERSQVLLTKQQIDEFTNKLNELRFWQLPTRLSPIDIGPDGAEWLIEGASNQEYHVVLRWSPKDGPVRQLGLMLTFDLGRLKIPAEQIY